MRWNYTAAILSSVLLSGCAMTAPVHRGDTEPKTAYTADECMGEVHAGSPDGDRSPQGMGGQDPCFTPLFEVRIPSMSLNPEEPVPRQE